MAAELTQLDLPDGCFAHSTGPARWLLCSLVPCPTPPAAITLWSDARAEEPAALAMLIGEPGGGWVSHFPLGEIDHVWRVVVNSHVSSRSLGVCVHVRSLTPSKLRVIARHACSRRHASVGRSARALSSTHFRVHLAPRRCTPNHFLATQRGRPSLPCERV